MIKFVEFLSFQLLLWSPLLLAAFLYASIRSLKSAECSLISFWSSLIISSCVAVIITIIHKLSLGWIFALLEYYLAFSLFAKWTLIVFLITWPLFIFADSKATALKSTVFVYVILGLTGLSIELANKTYVVSSKKIATVSWDNFFNNNDVSSPPQNIYIKLTEPELESIRKHLNPGYDVTIEQLKTLLSIFLNTDDSVLHLIAENPIIDREMTEKLLKRPYRQGFTYYIGQRLAGNRSTPPDILTKLLELPDNNIRTAIARNKSTPRNILKGMNHPDADKTLQELSEDDNAKKLVHEIEKEINGNRMDNAKAKFAKINNLYIDSPVTLIELGKLSVRLFGTSSSNKYYEQAENKLRYSGGKFRLDNCRENGMILILLGKEQEAQQLLSKLNNWYPNNEHVRKLTKDFPFLADELRKYAVSRR